MAEKIQKAGAIILSSNEKNKIALLYRAKQNNWSFPKGHIEEGENPEEAMIREIKEETGLTISIIKPLPNIEYNYPNGEEISLKMFLVVSVDDTNLKLEFEGDKIEWTSFDKVIERLSHENLREYFKSVSQLFN